MRRNQAPFAAGGHEDAPLTALPRNAADTSDRGTAIAPGRYGAETFEDVLAFVCPTEDVRRDIVRVMIRDFVEGLEVRAPLPPGPRLFVSNHQMASDVIYFSVVVAGLSRQIADLVTWVGHYDLDAGQMNRWMHTRVDGPERTVATTIRPRLIDPRDPRAVKGLAQTLGSQMVREGSTFACLCVAGETERTEGEPMHHTGGAFLDAALAHDIPITPVRFNWGSGDSPDTRNMWPKHLARQLYVVGPSITAADLGGLSRPAQRRLVTDGINGLVVPRPEGHFAAAKAREARVRWLADTVGMGLTKAIFLDGLYNTPFAQLTEEGRRVVAWSAVPGRGDADRAKGWLYQFARWLSDGFGPARIDLRPHYGALCSALAQAR